MVTMAVITFRYIICKDVLPIKIKLYEFVIYITYLVIFSSNKIIDFY